MRNTLHKTEYVLKNYLYTRNDDWDLAFKLWDIMGISFTPSEQARIKKAHKLANFYTIERNRRKLRSLYPGSSDVEQHRFAEEKKYREAFGF